MNAVAPTPWGAGTTFAWTAIAIVVGQGAAMAVLLWWLGDATSGSLSALQFDGTVVALATLASNPVQIAILIWAARRRGWKPSHYLGLDAFRARDFGLAVAACAALLIAIATFGWLSGFDLVTPFQIESYTSTPSGPWLAALLLAVVVVGPFGEEVTFRGFLFRGWVGGHPTIGILAISLVWAIQHIQYDWFGMLQVFLFGILLGWVRWRSGSSLLTFLLHGLMNVEATVETVVKVHGML